MHATAFACCHQLYHAFDKLERSFLMATQLKSSDAAQSAQQVETGDSYVEFCSDAVTLKEEIEVGAHAELQIISKLVTILEGSDHFRVLTNASAILLLSGL